MAFFFPCCPLNRECSWKKKPDRKNKSWNLCLNLCSARWINPSLILVRNFNPLLLSILSSWLGSGLMNFSITLLKTLQDVKLRILTSILFHSMTAGKKEFLKKFVFVLKKRLEFVEHFLHYRGVIFWNKLK